MAGSRVPDALDALVAAFESAPGLAGVKVVDGPIVTNDPLPEAVYVGYDGDPDGDFQTVEFNRAWASIGQRAQDETFTVTCALVVRSGSTKVRQLRVRAYTLFAVVEDAVRADPSLGLPSPTVAALVSGSLVQAQGAYGLECRIPFQVAVSTRI